MHPLAFYLLLFPMVAHADLYKCTDKANNITYTNSACLKVGLKEAKIIPPPPPPAIDAPAKTVPSEKSVASKVVETPAKPKQTAAVQILKSTLRNSDACLKLNAEMGSTMDEMDAARGQGSNSKKQSEWNNELKQLQSEKNRLGCF